MSLYYKPSHNALRTVVRQFVERELLPHAQEWEEKGEVPVDVFKRYTQAGMLLCFLPDKYRGGLARPANIAENEWDAFHTLILGEELGRCAYTGVIWCLMSGTMLGSAPIFNFGSEEQRAKYLPRATRGEVRFCLGITEPEGGSDVANIRTTAVLSKDGKYYTVNGGKKWITNGLFADYMTTAVRTGGSGAGGISFLIIPLDAQGVKRRRVRVSGLHASGSALITMDEVRVPAENLIGKPGTGFAMIMANFNPERLALAVNSIALAKVCTDDATAHALRRKTFGKPLAQNQVIKAKLAKMERAVQSSHAWLEQLVHESSGPGAMQDPVIGAKLALLKVHTAQVLELCCREAQQIFGGLGMTKDGHGKNVEQISRDLRVFVVGGGSEEILDDLGVRILLSRARL